MKDLKEFALWCPVIFVAAIFFWMVVFFAIDKQIEIDKRSQIMEVRR